MPDKHLEIAALMERIREGSQDAVRELLDQYGSHLIRVIRRRLSQRLRSQFDSQDFVQSVWASFFAVPLEGYHFDSPEALLAYLTDIACNKVYDAAREQLAAQKRDMARVHAFDDSTTPPADALPGRQPTPSQLLIAEEEWRRLLLGLPTHHKHMLVLLREGHTHQEVARRLGLNEKTVRRVLERALDRIKQGPSP
jgi:RNA polymerase sigma factor (sigma-70 family)